MRKAPRFVFLFVAFALLAAAGPAAPQVAKPEPSAERRAEPALRLNLKLDDAARFTREAPREGASAGALPSLGGDARSVPVTPMPTTTRPFPKDTERGDR